MDCLKKAQALSNKIYTTVPVPKFPRNVFSLSRPVVGSCRLQELLPTECLEVLPGDGFNVRHETFLRTAPLVAPPLAKVSLSHHAFFIPAWQISQKFDDFITGGERATFDEHMPFTVVSDVYKFVLKKLLVLSNTLSDYTLWIDTGTWIHSIMEGVVPVMELFDYFRALPFKLPEFQPLQAEYQGKVYKVSDPDAPTAQRVYIEALAPIARANLDAFIEANPLELANCPLRINIAPIMAYQKVWSEFFRDENLVDDLWQQIEDYGLTSMSDYVDDFTNGLWMEPDWNNIYDETLFNGVLVQDGPNFDTEEYAFWQSLLSVKPRAWKKDRFTSALPFTQKGPDIMIPLEGMAPVSVDAASRAATSSAYSLVGVNTASQANLFLKNGEGARSGDPITLEGRADLSSVQNGSTIRDLRRAIAAEEFAEADGRFGNRYPENTLGQFGVYTPDARLPRCQFLGSSVQTVSFGEIAQTSETAGTPLGTLAGKGTSYQPNFIFKDKFTMHGYVIIMTSVLVQALYESGIHPMFSRFDRTEYAWPRYARLGEEPIYAKELSILGEDTAEDTVFGYAPRYSTYKSDTGSVHGQMKTTLSYWTMSRRFKELPKLSKDFVYNRPRTDAFAIENEYAENFYFEIDWKVRSSRLLPFFGVSSI